MRAALHHRFGGPEVLEIAEIGDPKPGPGEVLLAVRATALNRLDVLQRSGPALLPDFRLPHIAGMDVVGEVIDAGDTGVAVGTRVVVNPAVHCGDCEWCRAGDDGYCPATRVVGGNAPGGYAELLAVSASHVYPIPDRISYEEAVTIPTIWSTAWHGLVVTGDLRIGEWVMIHAAGSGVSTAAIQLAKKIGARVLATAGSERKLAFARKLGADAAVNNREGDIVAVAREVTGGRGVDMVFDHVGPALFQPSVFALRPRGRLVFCGSTSGVDATFNLPYAYHFGIKLLGADPYSYAEFAEMLDFYWTAGFEAVIDSEFPLERAADAQIKMESGDVIGKIVLRP